MPDQRYDIPEQAYRLGRNVWHDEASRAFPAQMATHIIAVDWPGHGLPLNQGNVGSCTAEALCAALDSRPDWSLSAKHRVYHQKDAYALYGRETADEGQPWPPNDPGGTGLAVCKAAKELGWISSYTHAFGVEQALRALTLQPVIAGMNWYSSFDSPDEHGVISISPSAVVRGGHEMCFTQILPDKELVGFWQSWGRRWGIKGRGFMSFGTCERLLAEDGDVTVPVP